LEREPIIENIEKVNKLFDQGHIIVIYTASREEDRYWTEAWLKEHGVKYDFFGIGEVEIRLLC